MVEILRRYSSKIWGIKRGFYLIYLLQLKELTTEMFHVKHRNRKVTDKRILFIK